MGKHKYSKVICFSNILGEVEMDTIPKKWEKWISIVQKKYGKTQTLQIYGFFKACVRYVLKTLYTSGLIT